ncbi:MAG: SURF1 family protein [Alphaproteobacteria bacterium]|nr:SURF1 family protein [Alphaproteobacteria bacterium]MBV9372544.1 SURF1 family protein [Alphaproteobacteria bacterium]MBV9902227.1 SURF1 family protein [Alphaproteobacteria bacterium]
MKLPFVPTLLVALAAVAMVRLGLWQLHRADEKAALQARYAENSKLPPMALPAVAAADAKLLYRRATAYCLDVTEWRRTGGRSAAGEGGTRFIASCRTGAEGPGFAADMGVSPDPKAMPDWKGGEVSGTIVAEPSRAGLVERLTGRAPPPRPMIVSLRPAPGLKASAQPSGEIANNSFAYAIQWFFFAATAVIVYLLALRRRRKRELPG